ncbi:thiolase family protein [Streptomyces sp. NPDC096311]|uniref:thiolase family protein n=1 Tax=Streptomyces sp. NPDC096311 TaxID=3366083 RepID=UPI00381FCB8D
MNGELSEGVSIIGVGCTPFGDVLESPELAGMTERELVAWAALEAMEDAGIEPKDVDAFNIGHVFDEQSSGSVNTAAAVADWIGMRNKPGFHHEAACSTGGMGLWLACQAVASGMYRTVMSVGVEVTRSRVIAGKPPYMREPLSVRERNRMTITQDLAYSDSMLGVGGTDSILMAYGKKYGLTLRQVEEASVAAAIKNRRNAVRNPLAALAVTDLLDEAEEHGFGDETDYMKSQFNPRLGALARKSDFYVHADAASAVIVCPTSMARSFTEHPVAVTGLGVATAIGYHSEGLDWESDAVAFAKAFEMARVDPAKDVDYMYVHDAQVCHQFVGAETAGYLPRGEGWQAVIEGRTGLHGDRPINTSGGRTGMGHAYGASIGAEISEAVKQMRGACADRQLSPPPEVSVVHGLGAGISSFAAVLDAR